MENQELADLIIDDNEDLLFAAKIAIEETCKESHDLSKIREGFLFLINNKQTTMWFVLDMNFREGHHLRQRGFHWLKQIKEIDPKAVVDLITAYCVVM